MKVLKARDLKAADINCLGRDTSDPYCIVRVGSREKRSEVIKKTLNPNFNLSCDFLIPEDSEKNFQLEIWDWDKARGDDFLGRITLPLKELYNHRNKDEVWLSLEDTDKGVVCLQLNWFTLTADINDFETKSDEAGMQASAVVQVFVDCCKNLINAKGRSPNPKLKLTAGQTGAQESRLLREYSQNPEFEQEFAFPVASPMSDKLVIEVWDEKFDASLGFYKLALSELLYRPNHRFKLQPYRLQMSRSNAQIVHEVKMMFLKRQE